MVMFKIVQLLTIVGLLGILLFAPSSDAECNPDDGKKLLRSLLLAGRPEVNPCAQAESVVDVSNNSNGEDEDKTGTGCIRRSLASGGKRNSNNNNKNEKNKRCLDPFDCPYPGRPYPYPYPGRPYDYPYPGRPYPYPYPGRPYDYPYPGNPYDPYDLRPLIRP